MASLRPKDVGLDFAIPIFFIQGDQDFTTPTQLAKQYLASIKAPRKELVPIKGRHFAMFMNSGQFLEELVKHVRPPTKFPGPRRLSCHAPGLLRLTQWECPVPFCASSLCPRAQLPF